MRNLITGGLGFIGSFLVQRLLEQGEEVVVVDDERSSVVAPQWAIERGAQVFQNSVVGYVMQEWGERRKTQFDVIFHLASPVGPAGILRYKGSIAYDIVVNLWMAIQMALESSSRLVLVSSSEVYGGGQDGLCREDMPCLIPLKTSARTEYAVGKLAAEQTALNMIDLDVVVVRPFNVAGPRQKPDGGFVLPRFVQQALLFEPITVFGDGKQVRAFTHVEDIVEGLIQARQRGVRREIYNLGNRHNYIAILDLAQKVIEQIGSGSITYTSGKDVFGDLYEEASNKFPDTNKSEQQLEWNPLRTVEETIKQVILHEKAVLSLKPSEKK